MRNYEFGNRSQRYVLVRCGRAGRRPADLGDPHAAPRPTTGDPGGCPRPPQSQSPRPVLAGAPSFFVRRATTGDTAGPGAAMKQRAMPGTATGVGVVLALAVTIVVGVWPSSARADGDPASDVLANQALFLPAEAGIPVREQLRLAALR